MKKKNPRPKVKNNSFNKVTVHSKTYGNHRRAARGSIKPARLNDTLARRSKELGVITAFGSEVHTLFKTHAGFYKETTLWQTMLSRLHKVADINPAAMLQSLEGLELNSRHPLKRFGNAPLLDIATEINSMVISLKNSFAPYFKKRVEGYCYDVIVLFFNSRGKATGSEDVRSRWLKYNEAAGELGFTFSVPVSSAFYLVCLRLHTGSNGVPTNNITSQGMRVMKYGEIAEE